MISKNELKYIQSLYHKKTRDKEKVFIVEGPKMVAELLQSKFRPLKIWTSKEDWIQKYPSAPVELITPEELERASHLKTAHEILAVAAMPTPQKLPVTNDKLILALDGIRDPGNMGTLIRIADWFGVDAIVASEDSADIFNPKVVQATMGSLFRLPVYFTNLKTFLSRSQTAVYGALLDGTPLGSFPLPAPFKEGVLLIGNESTGIREEILPYVSQAIKIPAFGQAESLNAAIAAAVLLGHLKIPTTVNR
jgi:TrmH family RNA methyltransferase